MPPLLGGIATSSRRLPASSYTCDEPFSVADTQAGPAGLNARPQAFFRCGSVAAPCPVRRRRCFPVRPFPQSGHGPCASDISESNRSDELGPGGRRPRSRGRCRLSRRWRPAVHPNAAAVSATPNKWMDLMLPPPSSPSAFLLPGTWSRGPAHDSRVKPGLRRRNPEGTSAQRPPRVSSRSRREKAPARTTEHRLRGRPRFVARSVLRVLRRGKRKVNTVPSAVEVTPMLPSCA